MFLAFHFTVWFESLNYTSVASSVVVVSLQPLYAFVGTYFFFKEPLTAKTVISGSIAILGSFFISWGDFKVSGIAVYGDILAVITCALGTGYFLFGQEVRKRLTLVTYTMVVYTVSTICLFFYILFAGESFGPYCAKNSFCFFLLALIPNLFEYSLFKWTVKWISTNVISIAALFKPIRAATLVYIVFSESLKTTQIVGGITVIVGIILFVIDINNIKKFFIKKG